MNKELFTSLVENYMNSLGAINAMHSIGFNVTSENQTFPLEEFVDVMLDATIRLLFTEEGADIIFEYLFGLEEKEIDIDELYTKVIEHVHTN